MPSQKRKRPHEDTTPSSTQTQILPTRRATRQNPPSETIADPDPEKQLRSGRKRADTIEKPQPPVTEVPPPVPRPISRDAPKTTILPPTIPAVTSILPKDQPTTAQPIRPPSRATRNGRREPDVPPPTSPPQTKAIRPIETPISPPKHPLQLQHEQAALAKKAQQQQQQLLLQQQIQQPTPTTAPPAQQTRPISRTPVLPPKPLFQQTPRSDVVPPSTSTTTPKLAPAPIITTPKRPTQPTQAPSTPSSDRNIDKVVLGNICFRAWYPSYYNKEVLGTASGNACHEREPTKIGGGKGQSAQPLIDRLNVCPCCFKYSRELVSWWEHVRFCERRAYVPGRKVYTHPKGSRGPRIGVDGVDSKFKATNASATESRKSKKKGQTEAHAAGSDIPGDDSSSTSREQGEWSVWEVDGEKDGLFCQNLSLFAKLFLDNKSVFFDVTGFNYFLLVYTPGPPDASKSPSPQSTLNPSRPRILGFFSKEKVSWDNNNLACILVFPPWQRKGLGSLLMGVSYAISRREGILGGPEKPISDLGRKGYKRFWAGEIARWLLSLPPPEKPEGEFVVSIDDCSKDTWIVPEDCLLVLREMGLVEEAGLGPEKREVGNLKDEAETSTEGHAAVGADVEMKDVKLVSRVRIDKAAVRKWVESHRIKLERTCDPDGFVQGYAIRSHTQE